MAEQSNTMTHQGSYEYLIGNIYTPVFLDKLAADWGFSPNNEQDVMELLSLAGKLEQLEAVHQTKQATSTTSFIAKANQGLDPVMQNSGLKVPATAYNDHEIKEAAQQLAKNAQVREAALVFQDAMSQQASA